MNLIRSLRHRRNRCSRHNPQLTHGRRGGSVHKSSVNSPSDWNRHGRPLILKP